MPTTAHALPAAAPYRQPYANPQRNSLEPVAPAPASVTQAPALQPLLTVQGEAGVQRLRWLLGSRDGGQIAALGEPSFAAIIDARAGALVRWLETGEREALAYLEDADQLVTASIDGISVSDIAEVQSIDRASAAVVSHEAQYVVALWPRRQDVLVMARYAIPSAPDYQAAHVIRRPSSAGKTGQMYWHYQLLEQVAPSPVLSDGTLVMHRQVGLRFLAPDGLPLGDPHIGQRQGRVLFDVEAALRPGFVSADAFDRVWGFRATDGALLGWDAQGKSLGSPLTLGVSAAQPPVALPDGAVAVIAPQLALKIKDGAIVFRTELPPGEPLATADRDGRLLVRAGQHLVLIAPDGQRLWSAQLPQPITSNPLITGDGRLCVALGFTVYCSS